jgi:ATP-dependent Clp protease ATP-binding subunit ClpB
MAIARRPTPEGEDTSEVREQVMGMVRAHFRPEFLNRVDEIILSHHLQKSEMGRIVEIQFAWLQKLLEERKITLTLDAAARDWLAAKGWDPAYGARPLKRVIQRNLQDPLAEMILAGEGAYIARNISALHCLPPFGPEQERTRTTIVPFPNR